MSNAGSRDELKAEIEELLAQPKVAHRGDSRTDDDERAELARVAGTLKTASARLAHGKRYSAADRKALADEIATDTGVYRRERARADRRVRLADCGRRGVGQQGRRSAGGARRGAGSRAGARAS
jgi:hypothetical protein